VAQAQQQAAAQQQQQQQMLQFQMQLEAQKVQMDKYKADLDAQVDIFEARLQSELKEAELVMQGLQDAQQADIDRAQAQSPGTNGADRGAGSAG
jgi:hypothetical protein